MRSCARGIEKSTTSRPGRPDVVYNGKTVGPCDKDKVLLRWKLDDGRYAVIYGDLHSETVTAQRLATLR